MNIAMSGIDYTKASVDTREKFSFTDTNAILFLGFIKSKYLLNSATLLSTCNRTELYVSYDHGLRLPEPYEMVCAFKNLQPSKFAPYFVSRRGAEAVRHLFELSCGLKSLVFGEEQILSQVKNAAAFSREHGCSDAVLDTLFQRSVASAKKVISTVKLANVDNSVAMRSVSVLKEHFSTLHGLSCLVIGNGETGRLVAQLLIDEGAEVFMTLRKYKNKEVAIPDGCRTIPFEERYRYLNRAGAVLSATRSPHYMLEHDACLAELDDTKKVFIDLAVPRDIDPDIRNHERIVLYDIDDLGYSKNGHRNKTNIDAAKKMAADAAEEYVSWYYFRNFIPRINEISAVAADDVMRRSGHYIRSKVGEEEKRQIEKNVYEAAYKVVGKLMYGFKENLNRSIWDKCIVSMEKTMEKQKNGYE